MTQNPQDPMFEHFEAALSRAALSGDPSKVQALRDVLSVLDADPASPGQLVQFQAMLDLLQGPEMVQAPEGWTQAAMNRLRELEGTGAKEFGWLDRARDAVAGGAEALREVWATLALDSYAGAALPGIRGNSTMQPRQLMYESPSGTILLQVEKQPEGRSLMLGQFLPSSGTVLDGAKASLLSGPDYHEPTEDEAVAIEETGEFRFSGIEPGDAYLRLLHGEELIQIEPIHLTAQEE